KESDNRKAAGIVVIWLGKNPNSSRVWPFLGVVHNSSQDARLSEAATTIIGSNREQAEYDESNTYVLEIFNTIAGNPVKEILLKLNLPDHRSILTDSNVTPTKHGRITKPYSSPRFIANCFIADSHKDGHGVKELQERCTTKAFKLSYQEKYEHVGPKLQIHKMARLLDDVKRLCLVDDLKKLKITFMSKIQVKS
ncbi:hypothetical protein Tco_1009868, partial [Tanacetum coccineum]